MTPSERRAKLVENMHKAFFRACPMATPKERMSAAIDIALEEAARIIEHDCHDDMTRAEEAAAIRALIPSGNIPAHDDSTRTK